MPNTHNVAILSAIADPGDVCVLSPIRHRRRSSIVTAALALAVDGYDAVALRVVADRAGVATGTVYQYFSSKDDLVMACFHRWIVTSELAFHHEMALVADPAVRLHRVVYRMTESLCAAGAFADAVSRAYLCADQAANANAERARDALSRVFADIDNSDGTPRSLRDVSSLFADCWVMNVLSVVHGRVTVDELHRRLTRTASVLMVSTAAASESARRGG